MYIYIHISICLLPASISVLFPTIWRFPYSWGYPNSWMVYDGKSPTRIDDLGVPSFYIYTSWLLHLCRSIPLNNH